MVHTGTDWPALDPMRMSSLACALLWSSRGMHLRDDLRNRPLEVRQAGNTTLCSSTENRHVLGRSTMERSRVGFKVGCSEKQPAGAGVRELPPATDARGSVRIRIWATATGWPCPLARSRQFDQPRPRESRCLGRERAVARQQVSKRRVLRRVCFVADSRPIVGCPERSRMAGVSIPRTCL
jgi:hypothetical protein